MANCVVVAVVVGIIILVVVLWSRSAASPVDEVEKIAEQLGELKNKRLLDTPILKKMYAEAEQFLREKQLIVYGGAALNEMLPEAKKFYGPADIPDYDVFSPTAATDALEFARQLTESGLPHVEVKEAKHPGTYKVYADFLPLLDVTQLPPALFELARADSYVGSKGLRYSGPLWLRIDLYGELADVAGNTDRWPKVYKRLVLLNKYAPISYKQQNEACTTQAVSAVLSPVFDIVILFLKTNKLPVFGTSTPGLYKTLRAGSDGGITVDAYADTPDVYVLATDPQTAANELAGILNNAGFPGIDNFFVSRATDRLGTYLSSTRGYTVNAALDSNSYQLIEFQPPPACVSVIEKHGIHFATPQAMINLLLNDYFNPKSSDHERLSILCLVDYLTRQMKNGVPTPKQLFPVEECYGKSRSLPDIMRERAENPGKKFAWKAPKTVLMPDPGTY